MTELLNPKIVGNTTFFSPDFFVVLYLGHQIFFFGSFIFSQNQFSRDKKARATIEVAVFYYIFSFSE